MYIVVAGGGMVGGTLVRKLVESKFDIVMIERDKTLCEKIFAETGAIVINGSASDMGVLEEAKIAKADDECSQAVGEMIDEWKSEALPSDRELRELPPLAAELAPEWLIGA